MASERESSTHRSPTLPLASYHRCSGHHRSCPPLQHHRLYWGASPLLRTQPIKILEQALLLLQVLVTATPSPMLVFPIPPASSFPPLLPLLVHPSPVPSRTFPSSPCSTTLMINKKVLPPHPKVDIFAMIHSSLILSHRPPLSTRTME